MRNNSRRLRSRALCVAAVVAGGWGLTTAGPAARGQDVAGQLKAAAQDAVGQAIGQAMGNSALGQVPADALVVLKVAHLGETNTKVIDLLQQLGVADLVPQAKDPLKTFEDQTGIPPAAVDAKRDAVLYMPNMPAQINGDADRPPVVLLLPVADYKALTGAMADGKPDGDLTVGQFKADQPETVYVAHWGDYAAIAPKKELLAGAHDGLKPTGSAAHELDQKDVCLFVNFPALKPTLLPALAKARVQAQAEADRRMADVDPAKKQLGHALADQGFNVVERFLTDAQPTTAGVTLGKTGVSGNLVVAFAQESYLANLFGHMKTTDGPLLGGLPDEKYLFFGGSVQDPKMITQLIDDLSGPILPKLAALGEQGAKVQQFLDLSKSAMADSQGGAVGLVVPTAAIQQGSLVRYIAVFRADAEKLKAAQEQSAVLTEQLMTGLGVPGADLAKVTVTKAVKTVDGVPFDLVENKIDPAANNAQAAQAQQMMSFVYGPDGQASLVGAVDPHTLLTTMGVDDQLLGSAVEAAKANKDVLTAQVKAVDAQLPKARSGAAYLDLAQFVTTGLSYAHAMGMNMPVQLPPNLPPVGFSAGSDPDAAALRLDTFVPTSLMQALVQAGFQVYLQAPHGGGGGL